LNVVDAELRLEFDGEVVCVFNVFFDGALESVVGGDDFWAEVEGCVGEKREKVGLE
jgi:hypothetical protein